MLEGFDAKKILAYRHSGFSVDTSVCIAAHDRAGLERLLRCCARPAIALDRLRKAGIVLVCRSAKQHSEPVSKPHNKRGAKVDEITRTPLELIERIAALVPADAAQAPDALPMGGVDCSNLRSVPFVVPYAQGGECVTQPKIYDELGQPQKPNFDRKLSQCLLKPQGLFSFPD